jgi:hypothetical protein
LTAAVQWSPGEVDVWTRAFAEDHAQRAGLSVRDWLEQFVFRETALAGPDSPPADPPEAAAPPEHAIPSEPADELASAADELEPGDPLIAWAPPRDAFGQRMERPELAAAVDGAPASGVGGGAAAATSSGFGDGEDDSIEGHFSARARVAGLWDLAEPRRQLDDDDIELLLGGPVAPTEPPEAPRLDEVETELRQVREEVQAAAPHAAARTAAAASMVAAPDGLAPALGQASADAIVQLGVDIARLVEVVDCGFERLEAVGAKQAVDLRSDVARMLDELARRLEHPDREAVADAAAEPPPAVAWDDPDAEPTPAVASNEPDAEPTPAGAWNEPHDDPTPAAAADDPDAESPPMVASDDSDAEPALRVGWDDLDDQPPPAGASDEPDDDLFDDPADFASITHQGPFGRALAAADDSGDLDLAATAKDRGAPDEGWADRGGWSEATATDFEPHIEDPDPSPPLDHDVGGLADHSAEAKPEPASNPDKGFSWLRFRGGLSRKRA